MKKLILIIWVLAVSINCKAQQHYTIRDVDGKKVIECTFQNGMLNGKYISYYPNGIKKSEGQYVNNQRQGIWSVWDAHGKKRVERDFRDAFTFTTVNAWDSMGMILTIAPQNNAPYNIYDQKLGYKPWYPITEKEVGFSKRLWRTASPDSAVNKTIFENGRLYKALLKGLKDQSIKCYTDDECQHAMDAGKLPAYEKTNISALRIKEDVFYNKTTRLAEIRIIGIGFESKTGENKSTTLCWFYFPDIRDFLAKQMLPGPLGKDILNLENIFTERYFSSSVYKESNVFDREIADYKRGIAVPVESKRCEMQAIDNEFEYWYKK